MILSFSKTVGQFPRQAAIYHFGSKDSNGERRSDIEILHGSVEGVLKIAERVPYNEQFKLITVGLAPTDNPSSSELSCVAQDMFRYAYAGYSPERFAFYICVHRKKVKPEDMTKAEWGMLRSHFSEIYRTDMHGFFANVDLETGRPFNIAPRPRMPGYNFLGAMHDWRNGFARPGDPRRARLYSPGERKAFVARLKREGRIPGESSKDFLGRICKEGIDDGVLRSHADIEELLSYFGDLKSETRDSITLQESESGLFIRLKGKAFHHDFSPSQIVGVDPEVFVWERLEAIEYNKAHAYQGDAIQNALFDPIVSDGRL